MSQIQCVVCQQAKHELTHPAGLLQPLPIPQGAWQDWSLDFIEGLPLSKGSNVIFVVVDRFTKYAHFLPLRHPFTAQTVAKPVLDSMVKLHGFPKSIVSDRDKVFTSTLWRELFTKTQTTLLMSSSYHPQTDGHTERVNQCLEMYLRCVVHSSPKQWKSWLALAALWCNSNFHTSLVCSPFKALYGYDPPVNIILQMLSTNGTSDAEQMLQERQSILVNLKQHLAAAQNRMKLQDDKKRSDQQFQVGDRVLLKLEPYVNQSVVSRPYPKLALKYYGPYEILEKMGAAAYKIDLQEGSLIHSVFHVSQLKPFTSNYSPVFAELPPLIDLSSQELQPERVLERRLVKKGNQAVPQVKVTWRGCVRRRLNCERVFSLFAACSVVDPFGQCLMLGHICRLL
jgi:hypothetical protein